MKTEIKTITGIRNNKEVSIDVEVTDNERGTKWIKKANGKPFYGTTGYYRDGTIQSYRGKELMTNVTGV